MIKKLKSIFDKIIFGIRLEKYEELEKRYQKALIKILEQDEEIKNLKLRLLQLINQGEIKWK